MEIALGFVIAVFIAITGVGAGSMTTPLLILLLNMPTKQAVGTALVFGAAVKILSTPLYIVRKQVNWRALPRSRRQTRLPRWRQRFRNARRRPVASRTRSTGVSPM